MELVAKVRTFVDGFRDLTESIYPTLQQESTLRRGVQRINDVETLDLIADICEVDHPASADAASERSTVISSTPLQLRHIEQWTSDVVPEPERELADLELLTVTEPSAPNAHLRRRACSCGTSIECRFKSIDLAN
jgi:hypothetical protein